MLTAKGTEVDKVVGLQLGADDYVTKPFSFNELLARVTALLRRSDMSARPSGAPEIEEFDGFRIDRAARTIHVEQVELRLAPKEFDLLSLLLRNTGRVLSRQAIIAAVWGNRFYGDPKTVDVHVRWLREKFEPFAQVPFRITTVFGVGYRLDRIGGDRALPVNSIHQSEEIAWTQRSSAAVSSVCRWPGGPPGPASAWPSSTRTRDPVRRTSQRG